MKIDIYAEDGSSREKLATFTLTGIDEIAKNDIAQRNGSSQPKLTLSFELSRSGLIQLNAANVKIEETYTVEEKPPRKAKIIPQNITNATDNTTESAPVNETTEQPEAENITVIKKTKKRPHSFPLYNIEKAYEGQQTLSRVELQLCKERLRWFEKRDEDRAKTDKAKNDFESVIYAMRDWINEDENIPFVGTSNQETLLKELRENEDWLLEGEGE